MVIWSMCTPIQPTSSACRMGCDDVLSVFQGCGCISARMQFRWRMLCSECVPECGRHQGAHDQMPRCFAGAIRGYTMLGEYVLQVGAHQWRRLKKLGDEDVLQAREEVCMWATGAPASGQHVCDHISDFSYESGGNENSEHQRELPPLCRRASKSNNLLCASKCNNLSHLLCASKCNHFNVPNLVHN